MYTLLRTTKRAMDSRAEIMIIVDIFPGLLCMQQGHRRNNRMERQTFLLVVTSLSHRRVTYYYNAGAHKSHTLQQSSLTLLSGLESEKEMR